MKYKITKKFGMFEYNPKTRGHKIIWYEVDDLIDEKLYARLSRATQKYCKKVAAKRKKE